MKTILFIALALINFSQARHGFGTSKQDWGYSTVRRGAHMFWWLYYTTANVKNYTDRPLIIWLQGGPGESSTGYGNFEELGPLNLDLKERNYSWVKNVNVLFVDNPVGTGFSYVDDHRFLATTNEDVAADFLQFMKNFYQKHPEFIRVPLYILAESYGGKMAIEIALVLDKAIKTRTIKSNFIGVGLGDSWINPVLTVSKWAPYLFALGVIDRAGNNSLTETAQYIKDLFNAGRYNESTMEYLKTTQLIAKIAGHVDFYNILQKIRATNGSSFTSSCDTVLNTPGKFQTRDVNNCKLEKIMWKVKESLALNVTWGSQKSFVFSALQEDFMKPVTHIVEEVLNTTNIKVTVYNGQLDLVVCILSTVTWVENLQWLESDDWDVAERYPMIVNGIYEGFKKEFGNLALYWVNRAGHMVPHDNPAAMDYILRQITQHYDGTIQRK